MNRSDVQAWLDRYVDAWRANDAAMIEALFSDDAVYRYRPYGEDEVRGSRAIAASWLEHPDEPGSWEAHYEAWAVDGQRAVAVGTSRYAATATDPDRTYANCYLLEFDAEGRCTSFTEFYMAHGA
jgi:ketosteroid isomerase-like protein